MPRATASNSTAKHKQFYRHNTISTNNNTFSHLEVSPGGILSTSVKKSSNPTMKPGHKMSTHKTTSHQASADNKPFVSHEVITDQNNSRNGIIVAGLEDKGLVSETRSARGRGG